MRSPRPILVLLAGLLAALALGAASARADGDPASDFLLGQSTYLSPYDGHVSKTEAVRLVQMLAQLRKKGFPLKVAVIVTRYDLGAVPILFGDPKKYAKFLGEEDYYYWKDELLVVMPAGYGIYKAKKLPTADRAAIDALPAPTSKAGTDLVVDAEQAVRTLARLHGIKLAEFVPPRTGSGANHDRLVIGAGILVIAAIAIGSWFVFRRRKARA